MKFARYSFAIAAVLGILSLVPLYFQEDKVGTDSPPAITHPEFFYGFIGVALAFRAVFLIIASDPVRYRPMMLASVIEKFSWGITVLVLVLQERLTGTLVAAGAFDATLGVLFLLSYLKTPNHNTAIKPVNDLEH